MNKSKKDMGDMPYYQESDNLDREKIEECMKLSVEELDKLIAEEIKKSFEI